MSIVIWKINSQTAYKKGKGGSVMCWSQELNEETEVSTVLLRCSRLCKGSSAGLQGQPSVPAA